MASMFITNGRNVFLLNQFRRLSSYNNNRTKFGIVSLLKNEDLSLWSESNWSELAKQFNKPSDFPLAGQIGVSLGQSNAFTAASANVSCSVSSLKPSLNSKDTQKSDKTVSENLNFLLNNPLASESQAIKLREAAGGLFYLEKMEKSMFNPQQEAGRRLFELTVHKCPVSLVKDFQNYFKSNLINESSVSILTISFKTEHDMATWNSQVEAERELLVKKFVDSAQELCSLLEKGGFWADFIDPSSGKPYKSEFGHATFYETDERYRQLGFEIVDYGCCKVISHHLWGTKTYVGSLLTNAPSDNEFVKCLLKKFND